jgi:hypothetical protein
LCYVNDKINIQIAQSDIKLIYQYLWFVLKIVFIFIEA